MYNKNMKRPLAIDELLAVGALGIGLLFNRYPLFSALATLAIIYLFICVVFRKYEDVQRRLHKK